MRAAVYSRYGAPKEVVEIREIEQPSVTDDGVLVRVRASSVNRGDWYATTGTPYFGRLMMGLLKPKAQVAGTDFAGIVEAVGKDVTAFRPGDEVFGGRSGAFAEYVSVRNAVVLKPAHVSFEEAAAVPVAALTALQALRDHGRLQPGQRVLVNGASGGVGTFAVQIAKALGASEVTAVCSTRNVEAARSIGADHVVDYTRDDFTQSGRRYDLIFDNAGNRSWRDCKRVLEPKATLVIVGGQKGTRLLGPLGHVARLKLASLLGSHKAVFFIAKFNRADMQVLRGLLDAGKITPVIERRYELDDVADALRYIGEGHARSKVVINV
jgi:NADPH:quinone reductase-like Zn-dependent oxidoreductase